ncbi:isocitrate lyase/PEP mutase family protein [Sphingomonas oligoaromativorans]|uniref:isocitrate lyase/PEP mutase family protein n=1 Tax=Sphingomonas oligoaromativorans TaxID=575322 RepID=UPI00141D7509|nr:isocitrate lyase/phosphoenolpyruvate mutase family protein [Sphingomonas oligoaromativorans]NIJ34128.1 2-methylisocitrate lyase-like PEP mutase family enzyme [Sphingomonas oligoaromativorans]
MTQSDKATAFAKLHVKGTPVVLYNAWDAGSAKAIEAAGARAIATGSWSVAAAQGYSDGEDIPLDLALAIVARITASIQVPLTVDFEGGYSDDDATLVENIGRLLDRGAIGINFEDRVVKGSGLYGIDRQARRIGAIRSAADKRRVPLFINARTDLFLGRGGEPASEVGAALERAKAYAAAGASGYFIPGLKDEGLISRIVEGSPLPVNVMVTEGVPANERLADLGVARISYGPIPYIETQQSLQKAATDIYA